tara:strand:+ start:139 stop:1488 length:1350 start_codon:yes stop_codon:yes gene_type:complete
MSEVKIHAIGGYNEVGKNMTALEMGSDVALFDSGIYLPAIVSVTEREKNPTERWMRGIGALPNDVYLQEKGLRDKVRALLVSHAHLDHVGAIPYNSYRYKAPVLGTPFTMELLKVLMEDNNQSINNRIIPIRPNGSYKMKGKSGKSYNVEFINMTHSTIQSTIVAVHTPEGVVLYANDYKLDNSPVYGDKPNYKRLKELSKQGVKALVVDCLYAPDDRKTPSEKIAKNLLNDVLFNTDNQNAGLVVTTFSSHIARLKTIVEYGKKLNREIIFMGRSLGKYVGAARSVGKAPFSKDVKIVTYRRQLEKMLHKINRDKKRYMVVCTGHQGEPGSILDRISRKKLPLHLDSKDHIVFSSKTIPTPITQLSKEQLDSRLKKFKVRIFDGVHVSGHGGREDLRDLIKLTNPEHVIPSHGDLRMRTAGASLAQELGYKMNKTVHMLANGKQLLLK